MNKETQIKILDIALAIAMMILVVVAIPLVASYFDKQPEDIEDIVSTCSDLNLADSSQCALDVTKSFYKYNIDNVGKTLDFQTLKEEGGVCSSWSEYYSNIGSNLGFDTKNIIIPTGNVYHEFSVWSNEDSYCILDQTEVMCVNLQ